MVDPPVEEEELVVVMVDQSMNLTVDCCSVENRRSPWFWIVWSVVRRV